MILALDYLYANITELNIHTNGHMYTGDTSARYTTPIHLISYIIAMFCLSNPVNDIYLTVSAAIAATFLNVRLTLMTLW